MGRSARSVETESRRPKGTAVSLIQAYGQQRRSRIRQSVNDIKMMPAAFRSPRARPGLGQESSLPKKSRPFLGADPHMGLHAWTKREKGRALIGNFRWIETQVGVHCGERDWLEIRKRRDRHDPLSGVDNETFPQPIRALK